MPDSSTIATAIEANETHSEIPAFITTEKFLADAVMGNKYKNDNR